MSKNSTEQTCDEIMKLFGEIDGIDKESAGIALIGVIAYRTGNPFGVISQAIMDVKDEVDGKPPKKIINVINEKELVN